MTSEKVIARIILALLGVALVVVMCVCRIETTGPIWPFFSGNHPIFLLFLIAIIFWVLIVAVVVVAVVMLCILAFGKDKDQT